MSLQARQFRQHGKVNGNGQSSPAQDPSLLAQDKLFARARARDQRLIRAKEKRVSTNRARIQKIEIDIQERNNRAVSSLKRQGK